MKNTPETYPLGYVEDVFNPRTQLEIVFSSLLGLLEVPGHAAHKESGIAWYKMDVLHSTRRLVG